MLFLGGLESWLVDKNEVHWIVWLVVRQERTHGYNAIREQQYHKNAFLQIVTGQTAMRHNPQGPCFRMLQCGHEGNTTIWLSSNLEANVYSHTHRLLRAQRAQKRLSRSLEILTRNNSSSGHIRTLEQKSRHDIPSLQHTQHDIPPKVRKHRRQRLDLLLARDPDRGPAVPRRRPRSTSKLRYPLTHDARSVRWRRLRSTSSVRRRFAGAACGRTGGSSRVAGCPPCRRGRSGRGGGGGGCDCLFAIQDIGDACRASVLGEDSVQSSRRCALAA